MLRIKKGSEIYAYGHGCQAFTNQSELSQAILEHLQTRFPEGIEDDEAIEVVVTEEVLTENPELVEAGVEVGEVLLVTPEVVEPAPVEEEKKELTKEIKKAK